MKTQYAIALYLILGTRAFMAHAQTLSTSSPFVLAITNINSATIHVWTNSAVSFHFVDPGVVNVDELDRDLAKSGIRSERLIRIVERTNLVAEGRLLGRSWGNDANGFLLRFGSPDKANEAAQALRVKGAVVFPKHADRDGI